jgi:hypothetical protein
LGAIVRRIAAAAAVVIAAALVVAVPSVAGGQEPPGEDSSTTTTTRPTPNTSDDVVPTPELPPEPECDPSYPDLCIPPGVPDIDCDDIPEFTDFPVLPPDPHGFDGDNDGIGCESGAAAPPPPAAPPAQPVTEEPDFTG